MNTTSNAIAVITNTAAVTSSDNAATANVTVPVAPTKAADEAASESTTPSTTEPSVAKSPMDKPGNVAQPPVAVDVRDATPKKPTPTSTPASLVEIDYDYDNMELPPSLPNLE